MSITSVFTIGPFVPYAPPCKFLNTPVMSICLVKQNDGMWVEKHQRFLFNVYKHFFIFVTFFTFFNVFYFFLKRFLHLWSKPLTHLRCIMLTVLLLYVAFCRSSHLQLLSCTPSTRSFSFATGEATDLSRPILLRRRQRHLPVSRVVLPLRLTLKSNTRTLCCLPAVLPRKTPRVLLTLNRINTTGLTLSAS